MTPESEGRVLDRFRAGFDAVRHGIHRLLPGPLKRWVPHTAIGYLMINALTFSLDVSLMTLAYKVGHLPYPVAVSIGYVIALALAYLLNRAFNFSSHGAVGGELVRYVVVVVINYAALVVGISWLGVKLGLQFQVSRVVASCAEAAFMYCALRWVVFRRPAEAAPVAVHMER